MQPRTSCNPFPRAPRGHEAARSRDILKAGIGHRPRLRGSRKGGRTAGVLHRGDRIPDGQRGDRARRDRGRRGRGDGLPRHTLERDPADRRQTEPRRDPRRVVRQREGRPRGGGGRGLRRRAGHGDHEAGRSERGLRPADEPRLPRGEGRDGGGGRRRPGADLLPDRAGHPHLRALLQAAGLRPGLPRGGLRDDRRRVRALRALRHAGAVPAHHPRVSRQRAGHAARGAHRRGPRRLREGPALGHLPAPVLREPPAHRADPARHRRGVLGLPLKHPAGRGHARYRHPGDQHRLRGRGAGRARRRGPGAPPAARRDPAPVPEGAGARVPRGARPRAGGRGAGPGHRARAAAPRRRACR